MLLCKACNTRFEDGMSACPSCGRRVFASLSDSGKVEAQRRPLAESSVTPSELDDPSDTVDLELGEVDVLAEAVEPDVAAELAKPETPVAPPPEPAKPERIPAPPRAERARPEAPARPEPASAAAAEAPARARAKRSLPVEPGPAVFHLSAAQVRTLVTEQPELLEPGLEILRDKREQPVGVDYRTPVGAIDLLARDRDGAHVVVAVPDPRDVDTLVSEVLARIGWVRKHLAGDGGAVRGIVVIEEIPEELAYAAAGVASTVAFKAFRVALTFHDLPL